jgi:hypothetical protein
MISKMKESLYAMQSNLIGYTEIVDLLYDYELGEIIEDSDLSTIKETLSNRVLNINNDISELISISVDDDGNIVNSILDSDGSVLETKIVISNQGEVVSNFVTTTGDLVNDMGDYISTVHEAETIQNLALLLLQLQEEGELTYQKFMSSLPSVDGYEEVLDLPEFQLLLESAKTASALPFFNMMREYGSIVGQGSSRLDKIEFENADYNPLRMIPLSWSLLEDVVITAISVAVSIFAPVVGLVFGGIYEAGKTLFTKAKSSESYSVDEESLNNRLSIPIYQAVTSLANMNPDAANHINNHGLVKYVHPGLEHYAWKDDSGNYYSEIFASLELVSDINPFAGSNVLNLVGIPNNVSNLSLYQGYSPIEINVGTPDYMIDRAIFTSVMVLLRIALPDGYKLTAAENSSLRKASKFWTDNESAPTTLLKDIFHDVRIIIDSIDLSHSERMALIGPLGYSIQGTSQAHVSFKKLSSPVSNPDYVQNGNYPQYVEDMEPGQVVKLQKPMTVTNYANWSSNLNLFLNSMRKHTSDWPNEFGLHGKFYVKPNVGSGWRAATESEKNRALNGDLPYITYYTNSTGYLNIINGGVYQNFGNLFGSRRLSEYAQISGDLQYGTIYILFRFVVDGTSYWHHAIITDPTGGPSGGSLPDFYGTSVVSITTAADEYYLVEAVDVFEDSLIWKSIRDSYDTLLDPSPKSSSKVQPPLVEAGTWLKLIGITLAVTVAVTASIVVIKRVRGRKKMMKLTNRQKEYRKALENFNDDPSSYNYKQMMRASRRLNRANKRAGHLAAKFNALSVVNGSGVTSTLNGIESNRQVISDLVGMAIDKTQDNQLSLSDIRNLLKED